MTELKTAEEIVDEFFAALPNPPKMLWRQKLIGLVTRSQRAALEAAATVVEDYPWLHQSAADADECVQQIRELMPNDPAPAEEVKP